MILIVYEHYKNWIFNYIDFYLNKRVPSIDYLCGICLDHYVSGVVVIVWLWVRIRSWSGILDTTLCDNVCQWIATGLWSSPGTPVSFINKTDRHDITEILLNVTSNTINQSQQSSTYELGQDILFIIYSNFSFHLLF